MDNLYKYTFVTTEPIDLLVEEKQIVHNKTSRRYKVVWDRGKYEETQIVWSLNKYVCEEVYNGIDWQPLGSIQALTEDLTTDCFAAILNKENVFDFKYKPNQNDLLVIQLKYVNPELKKRTRPFIRSYISFIYNDNEWTINMGYDHIGKVYENYKEGEVVCSS